MTRANILPFLFAISLLPLFAVAALKDPFAGRWTVQVTPESGAPNSAKAFSDAWNFNSQVLDTTQLKAKGFTASSYEEDTRGAAVGSATFTCVLKSAKGDQIDVVGRIINGQLKGEMTWKDADGNDSRWVFTGSR